MCVHSAYVCIYISQSFFLFVFTCSCVLQLLCWFHLLAIANSVIMKSWHSDFSFLAICLAEVLLITWKFYFWFSEDLHLCPIMALQYTVYITKKVSVAWYPFFSLWVSHLNRRGSVYFIVVLICISPGISDVEHFSYTCWPFVCFLFRSGYE